MCVAGVLLTQDGVRLELGPTQSRGPDFRHGSQPRYLQICLLSFSLAYGSPEVEHSAECGGPGVCVCVCVCVYDAVTKNGFDEAWARLGRWEELREGRVRGSQL